MGNSFKKPTNNYLKAINNLYKIATAVDDRYINKIAFRGISNQWIYISMCSNNRYIIVLYKDCKKYLKQTSDINYFCNDIDSMYYIASNALINNVTIFNKDFHNDIPKKISKKIFRIVRDRNNCWKYV